MDLCARAERRDDKRGRTEAQSLPGLFGAGDGQRWLTCLGVFELAAAISAASRDHARAGGDNPYGCDILIGAEGTRTCGLTTGR